MKSISLLRGVSVSSIFLFDGDDRHLFAEHLERSLFDEQADRLRARPQRPSENRAHKNPSPATALLFMRPP
jgi:hypothetical protein